jgi:ABC-type nitrate/sulfonate/bicarbonate transport system permease component
MDRRVTRIAVEAGASAAIIALIWIYTASVDSYAVSPMPDVLDSFRRAWLFDGVTEHIVPSLVRVALGFGVAVLVGVTAGFLLGLSRTASAIAQPVVSFLRAIPAAALLPPAIVILGVGNSMKVFVIAFVACWPVLLNTSDGVRELDRTMLDTARVYGIGGLERLRLVILPAVAPRIFAGMRVSLAISVLLLVTSEMVASTNGIGHFVFLAQSQFAVADMWAGVILLGLIGFVLNVAFEAVERRVLRWHLASRQSS